MATPRRERARSSSGEDPRARAGAYSRLREVAPDAVAAYEALSTRAAGAGPLDEASRSLLKVALSVGRGSWRGVHAHVRKALEAGVGPAALRQVAVLAIPVLGLHASLDALRWIDEVIEERTDVP